MAYLAERVSYIKGLMDGMNIDLATNEGKLFKAIVDVLDDMALSIEGSGNRNFERSKREP